MQYKYVGLCLLTLQLNNLIAICILYVLSIVLSR